MTKLHKNLAYWIGFIIIVIVYSIYNLLLGELKEYHYTLRKEDYIYRLLCILAIYGAGTVGLKKYAADWMMYVWHLVHIVVIILLLLAGGYNYFIAEVPHPVRNMSKTLVEFLISPVMYIGVGILNTIFNKQVKNRVGQK